MESDSAFANVLRKHGFRATFGRVALLITLKKTKKPISAEHLTKTLKDSMDQANVYRALEAFAKAGIVRRVDVGHQHMHYELVALVPHHHHFVCADCGAQKNIHQSL